MEFHQSEFEVRLPIGYRDESGKIHRRAFLRKMRGHEEALLYDTSLQGGRLVTELLTGCMVRLGDLAHVDAQILSELYSVDRNYLLLELRRLTLGDRMPATYYCPGCRAPVALTEDLATLAVGRFEGDRVPEDIHLELEDGYVDRQGRRHTAVILTLPRGKDEEFVAPLATRDPLKAQDALMLRCIKKFGDLPHSALEAYGVKILRELTMGDRLRLQESFNGRTPGVDFVRQVQCPSCGVQFEGMLDVSHFFVCG